MKVIRGHGKARSSLHITNFLFVKRVSSVNDTWMFDGLCVCSFRKSQSIIGWADVQKVSRLVFDNHNQQPVAIVFINTAFTVSWFSLRQYCVTASTFFSVDGLQDMTKTALCGKSKPVL